MDIEPDDKKYSKNYDWLNQSAEENLTNPPKTNLSTIFSHAYFWTIYLLAASYICDIIFYFAYYQKKFQIVYYDEATYALRIITDVIFIFPILIYIKLAITDNRINYIIGALVFLPQLVLSLISLIKIYTQDYCTDNDMLCDPSNIDTSLEDSARRLNYTRITILRTSTLINFILFIIAVALTFLKIFRNY